MNSASVSIGTMPSMRVDTSAGEAMVMSPQPFTYDAIATDSNFAGLSLEVLDKRNGEAVNLNGASVAVSVVDETTGELIVSAGAGSVNVDNLGRVDFFFADEHVEKIVVDSVWLVEWEITAASGRVFRITPPCRLPVFRKL